MMPFKNLLLGAIFVLFVSAVFAQNVTQIIELGNVSICDDPDTSQTAEGNLRVEKGIALGDTSASLNNLSAGNSSTDGGTYSIAFGGGAQCLGYSLAIGQEFDVIDTSKNAVIGKSIAILSSYYTVFAHGNNDSLTASGSVFLIGSRSYLVHSDENFIFGQGADSRFSLYSFVFGKSAHVINYNPEYSSYYGNYSLGYGAHVEYSGGSFSIGNNSVVEGLLDSSSYDVGKNSYAIGANAKVLNTGCAYAIGSNSTSECYGQITLGSYNFNSFQGANKSGWNPQDPLLVLGNGTSDTERSNAFVVMKNGDAEIAGKVKIRDAGGDLSMGEYARPQSGN